MGNSMGRQLHGEPNMKSAKNLIKTALGRPLLIGFFCLLFLAWNLLADKTMLQIFRLSRDLNIARNRIELFQKKSERLKKEIKKSSDPEFVENEARERLDFAGEGDLIFIFPDRI